jgi:hypothetical protein
MDRWLRVRSFVLTVAILPGLLDIQPLARPIGSVDDAALLMLASQAMVLGPEAFTGSRSGSAPARLAPSLANGSQAAEVRAWMKFVKETCAAQRETLRATASGEPLQVSLAELDAACQADLADLEAQARRLERARQRGRGLQNFLRRTGRGLGNVTKAIAVKVPRFVWKEVVRPAGTILIEEVLPGTLDEFLQSVLTGGVPLHGKAGGRLLRQIFRRRLKDAGESLATEKVGRLLARGRRRTAARQLAAQGLPSPTPDRTQEAEMAELLGARRRVELTEMDFDSASVIWQLWQQEVRPGSGAGNASMITEVDDLRLWLDFDFEGGVLTGEFEGKGDCGTYCDDPEDAASSTFQGRIVDGWLKPDGQGGWLWGGDVEAQVSIAGRQLLGMAVPAEGEPFAQTIDGAKQGALAGRIVGSSQAACEGFSVTTAQPPCFVLGGPWDVPAGPSLGLWLECSQPSCGLPDTFPTP